MSFLRPPIAIHVWGGLGSQLYAVALRNEILEKYPKRLIKLHLHTGGVTKRLSELEGIVDREYLVTINDFTPSHSRTTVGDLLLKDRTKADFVFFRILRFLLLELGFVARMNDDSKKLRIKPWVRQIRGHYSTRQIPTEILLGMYSKLFTPETLKSNPSDSYIKGIHYRLGDLLVIGSKEPISIKNLSRGIQLSFEIDSGNGFLVFSDSVDLACNNLESAFQGLEFHRGIGSTLHAMNLLIGMEVFIGTPSKITEWITIFRLIRDPEACSIVPHSLKPQIVRHFNNSDKFKNLIFY
jgi:hypothetical protein